MAVMEADLQDYLNRLVEDHDDVVGCVCTDKNGLCVAYSQQADRDHNGDENEEHDIIKRSVFSSSSSPALGTSPSASLLSAEKEKKGRGNVKLPNTAGHIAAMVDKANQLNQLLNNDKHNRPSNSLTPPTILVQSESRNVLIRKRGEVCVGLFRRRKNSDASDSSDH